MERTAERDVADRRVDFATALTVDETPEEAFDGH